MKTNQKGFGAVEVLIVVVIVGLLGAVGWLVYDRQKNSAQENSNSSQPVQQEQSQKQEAQASDNAALEAKEKSESARKSFSAYGTTLSIKELDGWSYEGIYSYPGESSDTYLINVSNKEKDIQLSLQITTFESSLYEQTIVESFTGFNGKTFYITGPNDDQPGDNRYQQMGISTCNNGHCLTELTGKYNLNATITPIGSNIDFNGSQANIDQVKELFSSIVIN